MNSIQSLFHQLLALAPTSTAQPQLLWLKGLAGLTATIGVYLGTPAAAADRAAIRVGPVQQSVSIADLELFAETGRLPASLRPYGAFLTRDVRLALSSRLQLDPAVSGKLIEDFLLSSEGKRLLEVLEMIVADSSLEDLTTALMQAAHDPEGLSLLSVLRAYPKTTLTIDGIATITLASQLNLPYWQSQALSSILERELTVKPSDKPIQFAFDPSEPGRYWVRQQTLVLRDYQRERTIPFDLYWSRHSHGPMVVLSHGFGADRRFLGYLAYHLATHGFTVVALEHPASNVAWLTEITMSAQLGKMNEILPATEFIDRPKDISFLLDQLERVNRSSTMLRGRLNTGQVVVIGHSLGGYTALALAGAELDSQGIRQFCADLGPVGLSPADWLQCTAAELPDQPTKLKDPRIAEVMLFNPVIGRLFSAASLSAIEVPTLVLTGTEDTIAPAVSQQLLPFSQIKAPKYLLTAIGGTHLGVGDPANLNHALMESLLLRERRGQETEALRRLVRGVSLAFVKQATLEAEDYQPFLTSTYAQSLSTDGMKLRLNPDVTPKLSSWLQTVALPMERLVVALPKHSEKQDQLGMGVVGLLSRLPVVMFILPGQLPLLSRQFLWQGRKRQGKRNDRNQPRR